MQNTIVGLNRLPREGDFGSVSERSTSESRCTDPAQNRAVSCIAFPLALLPVEMLPAFCGRGAVGTLLQKFVCYHVVQELADSTDTTGICQVILQMRGKARTVKDLGQIC